MILDGPANYSQSAETKTNPGGDLLGALRRRKWLLMFGCALGLGLGLFYQFTTLPTFEAETEILVMSKASDLDGKSSSSDKGLVHEDVLSTHIQLFGSKKVIRDAIAKADLAEKIPSIRDAVSQGQDATKFIRENLQVTKGGDGRAKDANILKASFQDPSPVDAATVLSALVVSYKDFLGDMFTDTSNEALNLIAEAQKNIADDLDAHEKAYSKFREEAPLLWNGNTATNLHYERLQMAEQDLADVRRRSSEIRARLAVIQEFLKSSAAESVTDLDRLALLNESETERLKLMFYVTKGDVHSEEFISEQPMRAEAVRTEYERLLSLRLKERTLSRKYGAEHPMVQTVAGQISLVEEFLNENTPDDAEDSVIERMNPQEILSTFLSVLKNDLAELTQREKELEALSSAELTASKGMIAYEIQDRSMQAETTRLNELYDAIVERLREINMVRDYGGFLTEVISAPEPPTRAAWPRLPISGGLGMMMGLMIGCLLAMLAEVTDTTFRNPDDLTNVLGLPILAHTPVLKLKRQKKSKLDRGLITVHAPASMEAESYRGLRTAVLFSSVSQNSKLLVVTSPNPGDGKTTTSSNLAVTFAQSGKRTLIVDCDMRRPRVGAVFGIKNKPGMSNVLTGEVDLDVAIRSTEIDGLDVLPSGSIPPNPAELLGSDSFRQLLDKLREKYDMVVLDTPPLLPVSDPRIVAAQADGVILTMRVQKNGREIAVKARELLATTGVETLGLVVNASPGSRSEYGYRDHRASYSSYEYKNARNGYHAYYTESARS